MDCGPGRTERGLGGLCGSGVAGGDQVEKSRPGGGHTGSQQWPRYRLGKGKAMARGWTERYHLQAPAHLAVGLCRSPLGNGVTVMAPPGLGAVSHRSPGEGPGVPRAKAGTTG